MWGSRKSDRWWWPREVLPSWISIAPSGKGGIDRIPQKKCRCVRMGCLWCPRDWSELHMSPLKCRSISHSKKTITSAPIQGARRCWNGLNLDDGGLIFRLSNKCYGVWIVKEIGKGTTPTWTVFMHGRNIWLIGKQKSCTILSTSIGKEVNNSGLAIHKTFNAWML